MEKSGRDAASEGEVSALARGLLVLRAVADAGRSMGNAELSAVTGIPKATVSRLAATLATSSFLRQDPDTERYWLGSALLDLGNVYLRRLDLRNVARTHFGPVADATGCSIHMGIRDGTEVLIVESIRSRSAVIASQIDVGSRMSIATSAAGRAYLAGAPDNERDALLGGMDMEPAQRRRLEKRLRESDAEYRALGYTTSFGEWNRHINALGVTLTGPRGERYAVSCGGPAQLLTEQVLRTDVAPRLLEAREIIERATGAEAV